MFDFSGKRVLITGGAGAIGTNLVNRLLEISDCQIVVIDDLSSGSAKGLELEKLDFYHADINDDKILSEIFNRPVDVIFHLAAHFANQNSIEHPEQDLKTNILGTVKLLERARTQSNLSRFVYFNTSCMYESAGGFEESTNQFEYHTPYAISKHSAENYAMLYHHYYDLPVVSVRVFNSFGPHEYPGKYRNVIPNFIDLALKGESLPVMGDGTDTRSFTFIDDLITGILAASQNENAIGQIFNIGSQQETKIIDLAEMINKLTDNSAPIRFIPKRGWDKATRRKADISKAFDMLNYKNTTELEEGLKKTISWFKTL